MGTMLACTRFAILKLPNRQHRRFAPGAGLIIFVLHLFIFVEVLRVPVGCFVPTSLRYI
jgi:hypothetical protein